MRKEEALVRKMAVGCGRSIGSIDRQHFKWKSAKRVKTAKGLPGAAVRVRAPRKIVALACVARSVAVSPPLLGLCKALAQVDHLFIYGILGLGKVLVAKCTPDLLVLLDDLLPLPKAEDHHVLDRLQTPRSP